MDTFVLEAETRSQTLSARNLRMQRKIPAVFYGKGVSNLHLALPQKAFVNVYKKAGETNLVDLQVDSGKQQFKVLIHMIQLDPVTDEVIHVDLRNVRMDQKITTRVPVKIVGVAPVVKEFAGILSVQMHDIEIRCLPSDLIHEIQVDVSGIKTFHDSVHVRDLVVPATIEILSDKERTVISALAPKKEEEAAPAAVAAVPGAEGAAAPTEGAAAPAAGAAEGAAAPKKEEKKK